MRLATAIEQVPLTPRQTGPMQTKAELLAESSARATILYLQTDPVMHADVDCECTLKRSGGDASPAERWIRDRVEDMAFRPAAGLDWPSGTAMLRGWTPGQILSTPPSQLRPLSRRGWGRGANGRSRWAS